MISVVILINKNFYAEKYFKTFKVTINIIAIFIGTFANANRDLKLIRIPPRMAKQFVWIITNVSWEQLLVINRPIVGTHKEAINATVTMPTKLVVQEVFLFYIS